MTVQARNLEWHYFNVLRWAAPFPLNEIDRVTLDFSKNDDFSDLHYATYQSSNHNTIDLGVLPTIAEVSVSSTDAGLVMSPFIVFARVNTLFFSDSEWKHSDTIKIDVNSVGGDSAIFPFIIGAAAIGFFILSRKGEK